MLQLANAALSGGFGSLFYHDVREVHGYAYSVDRSFSGGHNRSTFTVNFGADPQNTERAQKAHRRRSYEIAEEAAPGGPA